jgi:guanylate kinase
MNGRLIVLSGPGGVGKSTIVSKLRSEADFFFSVSATTRPPRAGEIDGVDYHFVDEIRFDQMIADGEFLEWAHFAGYRYGTPSAPVQSALANGLNVLLEIEIDGARQIRSSRPDALLVFLQPPSMVELEDRIRGRGTDSPERIEARLKLAHEEMAAAGEFDEILINHQVEQVVAALVSLAAAK